MRVREREHEGEGVRKREHEGEGVRKREHEGQLKERDGRSSDMRVRFFYEM